MRVRGISGGSLVAGERSLSRWSSPGIGRMAYSRQRGAGDRRGQVAAGYATGLDKLADYLVS